MNAPKIYQWIALGLGCCPDALADQNCMTLFKFVLSECHVIPIFRDLGTFWHKDVEDLWNSARYKKHPVSKESKLAKTAANDAVQNGPGRRREARVYFRQELSNLVRLLTASPGLMAPKVRVP